MSYSPASAGRPQKRRPALVIMVGAVVLLLVLSLLHWLQTHGVAGAPTASVAVLQGTAKVWAYDRDEAPVLSMGEAQPLRRGDDVRTGAHSAALLRFGSGDAVKLDEHSSLLVLRLYTTSVLQGQAAALGLREGKVLVRSSNTRLVATRIELDTLVATIKGQGATFACEVMDKASVRVLVYEGSVRVSMGEQAVDLRAGRELEARLGQALTPMDATLAALPPDETLWPPDTDRTPTLTELEQTLFPPVMTPTLPGEGSAVYTVQQGDTLYSIAAKHGIAWQDLFEANQDILASPEMIRAGQTLRIPKP